MDRRIVIQGARTNNLRGISCEIPHSRLTVITGVSGSGKSSLAFDTLFAEGQRRYVESMSTYARQFLERLDRPDVDFISSIPPAIALEQRNSVKNARSTVGTATEINDSLRLLFAKVGQTICPDCHRVVRRDTVESSRDRLAALPEGTRLTVLGPFHLKDRRRLRAVVQELVASGFHRVLVSRVEGRRSSVGNKSANQLINEITDLADLDVKTLRALDPWPLVVDRLVVRGEETASRLAGAMEQAFQLGQGHAEAIPEGGEPLRFTSGFSCAECGRVFREPDPQMLSFNSPIGACPTCNGFGRITGIDLERVIPNPALTLKGKAIAPWNTPAFEDMYPYCRRTSGLPFDRPIKDFTAAQSRLLLEGEDDWCGIDGFFEWLEKKRYKMHHRIMLARYRGYTECADCHGSRLKPEALWIQVGGKTIGDLARMSIEDLRRWFGALTLPRQQEQTAESLLGEIRGRLRYLDDVGLGYLTLSRQTRTLSGGEAQRINLASALGSNLTATLYVLDEPTVGLHARDTHRLLQILLALRANGNTVVVIEHDPEVIRGADFIIDLGPGAGEHGGRVIFQGTVPELLDGHGAVGPPRSSAASLTGLWLRGEAALRFHPAGRPSPNRWITLQGASGHNLRDLTVRFPLRRLVTVTGVSGSGKSTLVVQTLVGHLLRRQGETVTFDVMPVRKITGLGEIDEVVLVDQSPLQRSVRSLPVTYTKAYDEIRKLLADTAIARARGIPPGHFSFNTDGGRCDACQGLGTQTVDMHFLADVTVTCEVCQGRRFKPHVLEITHRGKAIDDILALTVEEAIAFFSDRARIVRALQPLREVGLGYLRLGQSTATLSGGEAQRLKLAGHLMPGREAKHNLFVFDEPTTGLHLADVDVLLGVLDRLVRAGHSVIVIEHNLEVIASADWVIDLGPEGGDDGGRLVAQGPPEAIMACSASFTGAYLRRRSAAQTPALVAQ